MKKKKKLKRIVKVPTVLLVFVMMLAIGVPVIAYADETVESKKVVSQTPEIVIEPASEEKKNEEVVSVEVILNEGKPIVIKEL